MRNKRANFSKKTLLSEASATKKADLELAVVKCLSRSPLRPEELKELLSITQSDLIKDHGLDLYMAEQVKLHTNREQFRLRAQNLFVKDSETQGLYPELPYTRTSPMKEGKNKKSAKLLECSGAEDSHEGRMLDYGEAMSDADEGQMVRRTLTSISRDAQSLASMLRDEDDLPEWCQHYASQAELMVSTIKKYLEFEIGEFEENFEADASAWNE